MSIEDRRELPERIQTVLQIWQQTMNEARHLTTDEALSCASMMLGFVCLNITEREVDAHDAFNGVVDDIHLYINANWRQVDEARRNIRSRRR